MYDVPWDKQTKKNGIKWGRKVVEVETKLRDLCECGLRFQ
jgi:hypothetical protein